MLVPAQERDLPQITGLIREGAKSKSFDAELAHDSAESAVFFDGLRQVISNKIWVRPAWLGLPRQSPALAFVYYETAVSKPTGFVAVRGIGELGYELWLTALDPDRRGLGIGRRMLTEFLATREGKLTRVAQCALASAGAQACAHILGSLGFTTARVGKDSLWMARADLPPHILRWMETTPFVSRGATA